MRLVRRNLMIEENYCKQMHGLIIKRKKKLDCKFRRIQFRVVVLIIDNRFYTRETQTRDCKMIKK